MAAVGSVGAGFLLYSDTAAIQKGLAYTNYQQTGGSATIVPGTSAVVCGGDYLYAREVNRFTLQGCNVTPTTATGAQGALISNSPRPINLSTGLAAWFATTNLTFAQTQSIRNRIKNCLGSAAIGRVYGINAFYYYGDQLTDGRNNQAGAIAWPNQLAAQATYPTWAGKQVNLAMQNTTASILATSSNVYTGTIQHTGPSQYQKAISLVFYGTIDLANGATAATTLTNLQSIWSRIRTNQAGKVIAFTIAPRDDTGWTAPKEAERVSLNTQIRASSANYDALIDIDLIPNLTDPNNTTYYQADKFNLTTAGQTALANYVYATINPNTI
jgi:lysophospholipase L1-like esterase